MATKNYRYLNYGDLSANETPFYSQLARTLAGGQKKMPAKQWGPYINALTNKGVKKLEIDDSKILQYIAAQPEDKSITREELVNKVNESLYTIKEYDLVKPRYSGFSHTRDRGHSYQETLYILNSPRMNIDDRLAEIRFELEELDLDMSLLAENPMLAVDLHKERTELKSRRNMALHHQISHFQGIQDPETGQHIENVLGHARVSTRGSLLFIEEIQSDWGQRGRRHEWRDIPKAPYISTTESWAGLLLRRQLQRAAQNPAIETVVWMKGGMENGSRSGRNQGLVDFYEKILPKLADKAVAGSGEKAKFISVKLTSTGNEIELPGLVITESVRQKLTQSQPLYSKDLIEPKIEGVPMSMDERRKLNKQLQQAREMLGDHVSVVLAERILDVATGQEVAGQTIPVLRMVQASLRARNPGLALNHEAYHYAHEELIGPFDQELIERAFEDGSRLNNKVRMALVKSGASPEAVAQCDDSKEAAAYGFALWKRGDIALTAAQAHKHEFAGDTIIDQSVGKIFRKVEGAMICLGLWAKRVLGLDEKERQAEKVYSVFEQVARGAYAKSAEDDEMAKLHTEGENMGAFGLDYEPKIAPKSQVRMRA